MHVSTRTDTRGLRAGTVFRWWRPVFRILLVLLVLAGVVFSLSNRSVVLIKFAPLPFTIEAPIYLVLMSILFMGVLLGGVGMWLSGLSKRYEVRSQNRRLRLLEAKLAEERRRHPSPLDEGGRGQVSAMGGIAGSSDASSNFGDPT